MTNWLKKHSHPLLIFLFSLFTRLTYLNFLAQKQPPLKWLPYQLDLRALNLIQSQPMNLPDAWGSFHIILAGFYKLLQTFSLLSHRINLFVLIQNLLGATSTAIFYLLSKKLFRSDKIAAISSLIFATYYPLIYLDTLVLSETTFVFTIILALYFFLVPKRSLTSHALSGLCFGIALISRPILFTFTPFLITWLLLTSPQSQRWPYFFSLSLPLVSILAVASLLNARIDFNHRASFSSSTAVNFAITQCRYKKLQYRLPNGEGFWFSPPIYWNTNLPEIKNSIPFYHYKYYLLTGLNCLSHHPRYLLENLKSLTRLYHSSLYPNFNSSKIHQFFIDLWKIPAVIFTLAFFAYPVKAAPKQLPIYFLFLSLFISLLISVYLASPGEERYLASYFFILPLYAVPSLLSLTHKKPA